MHYTLGQRHIGIGGTRNPGMWLPKIWSTTCSFHRSGGEHPCSSEELSAKPFSGSTANRNFLSRTAKVSVTASRDQQCTCVHKTADGYRVVFTNCSIATGQSVHLYDTEPVWAAALVSKPLQRRHNTPSMNKQTQTEHQGAGPAGFFQAAI